VFTSASRNATGGNNGTSARSNTPWFDPASDWQMPGEKLNRFFQQLERVAVRLPLIQKFRFIGAAKTRHSQLTLRVMG